MQRTGLVGALKMPRRWARGLYDWTIRWAETPQSLWALFVIALVESSIFPIPPDVLLIAIVAAAPRNWWLAATLCSLGSLVGAAIGYGIGYGFMASVGDRIVEFYGAEHHWERVVGIYTGAWGVWFLAAAAFTPIPFKVATIAAGATGMPFVPFLLVSLVGRAGRFFLVALVLRIFGAPVRRVLEKHFDLAAVLFFVLLVGGFVAIKAL
jgi:membrane protein YqaA with SNARE-associated domain